MGLRYKMVQIIYSSNKRCFSHNIKLWKGRVCYSIISFLHLSFLLALENLNFSQDQSNLYIFSMYPILFFTQVTDSSYAQNHRLYLENSSMYNITFQENIIIKTLPKSKIKHLFCMPLCHSNYYI